MRAYSSSVRPREAAWATVTSDAHRALEQSADHSRAVGTLEADRLVHGVFGVGHHPKDIPRLIADPGDVVDRAVGVAVEVAEDDLSSCLHLFELRAVRHVAAFPV